MKGGFDLYGRYYPNQADAINAELAQCAEIDSRLTRQKMDDAEINNNNSFQYLYHKVDEIERKLNAIQKRMRMNLIKLRKK